MLENTVPNVVSFAYVKNDFCKTVIATVIAADTQCGNVVTNRNNRNNNEMAVITTFGTLVHGTQQITMP